MSMMSKEKLTDYFSSMPKTFCIFALVVIFITTIIFNFKKNLSIVIDGQVMNVTTLSSNLKNVFLDNGITIGDKDKVSLALDSKVKDGDKISIKRAVEVKLAIDGEEKTIQTAEDTVGKMLAAEKIVVRDQDKISLPLDKKIEKNMVCKITKVDEEIKDIIKTIEFAKEVRQSDSYDMGTTKVLQEGKEGEKVLSAKIIYEDGKEVSRSIVSEKVVKPATNEILAIGTVRAIKVPASRGTDVRYSKVLNVNSTAYTFDFNPNTGRRDDPSCGTATRIPAKRIPDGISTIAVDPRVIPLRTLVYVDGYGYAIAADTGGSIRGNIIDVFMDKFAEASKWGRRNTKVYILKDQDINNLYKLLNK